MAPSNLRRSCVVAAIVAALSACGLAVAAGPGWNQRIVGVETHRMVGEPATGALWTAEQTRSDVFYAGEQIVVHCLARMTKVNHTQDYSYTHEFLRVPPGGSTPQVLLQTKLLAGKVPKGADEAFWSRTTRIVDIQTATAVGNQKFGCRIVADDDDPSDNGPQWRQVTVLPKKPDMAGVFPVPAPEIVQPVTAEKLTPNPKQPVQVRLRIPAGPYAGKANLVDYAKASVEKERWQIEVLRLAQGPQTGFETSVGKFDGPLNTMEFAAVSLTSDWFRNNGGAGRYAVRAWLVQGTGVSGSTHLLASPSHRVEFEIVAPVVADAGAIAPANPPQLASGVAGASLVRPGRREVVPQPNPAVHPTDRTDGAAVIAGAASAPAPTAAGIRAAPASPPALRSSPGATMPPMAAGTMALPGDAIARELAAASCSAGLGGLRFACATRAGFDRCEALRRERKVQQCTLGERR